MTNFTAKIFDISRNGIAAQQAVIANAANNVANVNTEGFAQRDIQLESAGKSGSVTLNLGHGVEIGAVTRRVDQFLEKVLRSSTSEAGETQAEDDYLTRVDRLFSLLDGDVTIGTELTSFFTSLHDLTLNPSSIELRNVVVKAGENLVNTISNTYDTIANLQDEIDRRLEIEVGTINTFTTQIATLNDKISAVESGGTRVAATERDQRDLLLNKLADKISYDMVETSGGEVTLSLSNGFALVSGSTARSIEISRTPSFAAGTLPASLSGGSLGYVVYDFDSGAGTQHVNLTDIVANGTGALAGLLDIRGVQQTTHTSPFQAVGVLPEIASEIEAITRDLLTRVNTTYLGPDEDAGTPNHQASSADLNGAAAAVYGLFSVNTTTTLDVDGNGLPDDIAALELAGISNFSSRLQLAFSDPTRIAAARDQDATAGSTAFATGDGSNIEAIVALQNASTTFATGNFSQTGTFDDIYNQTVSNVGNLAARGEVNNELAQDRLLVAQNQRDEVSAVSLDEQFSRLISFQRAFEGSARMFRVADELLTTILQLI